MPLYCPNLVDPPQIFVFPEDTASDSTATALRTFDLPSGLTEPQGITVHGNDLYIADNAGDEIFVVPANTADSTTAVASRRFDLPSGAAFGFGITTDGNNLYILDLDVSDNEVYVVPANTADGTTAVASRRFDLPSSITNARGMTIDGNNLYIVGATSGNVSIVPADTADGQTASVTRWFDLPDELTTPLGMTIDDNDLYIVDDTGDEVFVLPADTADGQTAVASRRFGLPSGLTAPRGLTLIPQQPPTITTTDTDIRENKTFTANITFPSDVTGFTVSDIIVANGTRGALTGSGTDYALQITAGHAGTLTVSIPERVVLVINAAVTQTFTVNANPPITINTAIAFQAGQPQATGGSLTNGRFVVDSTADSEFTQAFTASRGSQASNKTITFSVVNADVVTQPYNVFRYRVEIAGVDVSDDLIGDPSVSHSLDAIRINAFTVGDCQIELKNIGGKYSEETSNNFWASNNITANGYLASVKVCAELYDGNRWHPKIIFAGIILESTDNGTSVVLGCRDRAYNLRIQDLYDIGQRKYTHVFGQDQASYQGEYNPEQTLLPILPSEYQVTGGATDLDIRQTQNTSEGLPLDDTAYVDGQGVFTADGLRDENTLLLKYKTAFRDIGIKHLLRQLTRQTGLATQIDLVEDTLSDAYHLNRGNIGFQANTTRVVRTVTDWVYDSTRQLYFVLMSNYQNHIADQIVEYDEVADRFRVVYEFPTHYHCLNFATTDYETFYVLTAGAAGYDRLRDAVETQDRFVVYDSTVTGHQNRILDVDITTGALAVHVDTDDDCPPQVGMHYHTGFENGLYADGWRGVVAENRASFEIYGNALYYRYAKDGEYGVASVNTSGTTSMIIDESEIAYNNHLNFGFTINSSGQVLMVYATGDTTESTLFVKQYSGGTVTTEFTDTQSIAGLIPVFSTGGYYLGAHEVIEHSGDLYCVVPIQKVFSVTGQVVNSRIPRNAAGAVLYKIDLANNTLTAVKTYDFVTEACRSLVVHDSSVHFVESPSVAYRYQPIDKNLDTFDDDIGYNEIDLDGALYQLDSSDNPVNLGRVWFGDADYRGAMCKALSVGSDLNMVVGSQYPEQILDTDSDASSPDNMVWVQRTDRLQYRLESFSGSGSVYDALARLAEQTDGTLTASQDLIAIKDREPYRATQDGAIGTTLPYTSANRAFPSSGYLLVDGEIIAYTGLAAAEFTGLTRGVLGSEQTASVDAAIVYCDNVIHSDILKNPYVDVNKTNDVNNLYNVITDTGKLVRVEDATSIAAFGEKVYAIDLGLSRHQSAWLETIYDKYLGNLKDIHSIYGVTLTQAFYLNLGEVVPLYHGDTPVAVRIVGLTWRGQNTSIQVRSV